MELGLAGYTVRAVGVRQAPIEIASAVVLQGEAGPVAQLEDLPFELEGLAPRAGARLGWVMVRLLSGTPFMYPPRTFPAGSVVDTPTALRVHYLPGLRGAGGEQGLIIRPLTVDTLQILRRRNPALPDLATQQEVDTWIRSP